MKIRLMGTKEEISVFVASLDMSLVVEVSKFYPNRGNSRLGRVYVETFAQPLDGSRVLSIKKSKGI